MISRKLKTGLISTNGHPLLKLMSYFFSTNSEFSRFSFLLELLFSCQNWNSCFVKTCGEQLIRFLLNLFYIFFPKTYRMFQKGKLIGGFFCESGDINDQLGEITSITIVEFDEIF